MYHLVQVGRVGTEYGLCHAVQLDALLHAPLEGGDRLILRRHVLCEDLAEPAHGTMVAGDGCIHRLQLGLADLLCRVHGAECGGQRYLGLLEQAAVDATHLAPKGGLHR